mmetsp:Transcript_18082/g.18144  ORF Transcript_18082/g.18144 Transcript_18082/m.18144 type:complete len:351 (+) Transcript_18082:97-1149(+)|eukprot:CAMPEP_0182427988 /NCGR_PEP_ID=MMETSP1167-20130531/20935_1 /TAXON_ID=2988 /ORGANISM="Mallomonas Sp, Strain CCMP3275" /LENGTH=350 /DNA_ID=CAMNT_0024610601 /DNA_START=78 /DNA_END=1130 /DNA_ORIENTATION=+
MSITSDNAKEHLREKLLQDITAGKSYDALQYIQSFIARKKKGFGHQLISSLIFEGAMILIQNGGSVEAGALLLWYIKGGAGEEFAFKINKTASLTLGNEEFCDLDSTIVLLESVSRDKIVPLVDAVYIPIQKIFVKKYEISMDTADGILLHNLKRFESICADVFESAKDWISATKCYIKLYNVVKIIYCVDNWASNGHEREYPMFFSRVILQLLAENRVHLAADVLQLSQKEYSSLSVHSLSPHSSDGYHAAWHVAIILTELAGLNNNIAEKQRVFQALHQQYSPIIAIVDKKLLTILVKIAAKVFLLQPRTASSGLDPMALMRNLMGGSGGSGGGADAIGDIVRNLLRR